MDSITQAVILLLLGSFAFIAYTFAPWAPTRTRDLQRVLKLADLQAGDTMYDL